LSAHLLKGDDPILRADALDVLVTELLGGDDRSLAVEDVSVPGRTDGAEARELAVDTALNAARTPPFMTEARVVIVRDVGALSAGEAKPLVDYLEDPLPTTALVFVAGGGTTPKALEDRVKKIGTVTAPGSEKVADVLSGALERSGLRLRPDAVELLRAHVGNDAGLLPGLVDTLTAVHGNDRDLDVGDISPYLGGEGSIPSWDLTNAIEKGDIAGSLTVLRRLLTVTSPTQPRPMHPLQVLGVLHGHFRRLLRLDDPAINSAEDAAAALGGRTNPNSARFRLRQAAALGTDGIREAFGHLARADLDLKGKRAIPPDVVMEVLVARLARLGARSGAARGSGGGARRGRRSA
jgi:DNA polymerase-3 subunit delta